MFVASAYNSIRKKLKNINLFRIKVFSQKRILMETLIYSGIVESLFIFFCRQKIKRQLDCSSYKHLNSRNARDISN
jgi:hypothetical protein